jgi:hypothetical protein
VSAIAKRLIRGLATSAQGDSSAPTKTERGTGLVDNFEIAFNAYGAVVKDRDSGAWHSSSEITCKIVVQ